MRNNLNEKTKCPIYVQSNEQNKYDKNIFSVGLFARVTGVIHWEQAIYGAASSAVISGGSILANLEGASCYSVVCTIEVENWTPLMAPDARINGGINKPSPIVGLPGQREQLVSSRLTLQIPVLIYCSFSYETYLLKAYPD